MSKTIRVTVWNEYRHEKKNPKIAAIYPEGMHGAIAKYLRQQPGLEVRTATLDEPQHGLTDEVLNNTDVLTWWGHLHHAEVQDAIVDKVHKRVLEGMGLIVLHSGHMSKPFRKLMGTGCMLKWREIGEKERLWVVKPGHPIVEGVGEFVEVEHEEMYGEHYDIPAPDELIFISWFAGGEVFRSGCCFYRGCGKIFYFRPGHETYPIYHHPGVLKVIENAVRWAAPTGGPEVVTGNVAPLEPLSRRMA
jgi:trehalose utilization protein